MIISDPHFAVNISPFTVYLIDRHGELDPGYVDRLNSDFELTGKVFRFKHVLCSPGQLGNFMSSKYSSYLEGCNVLIRLFPNEKQYFYYMIDTIKFDCSYDFLRYSLSNFLATISYQDSKETWLYWCRIGGHASHLYETLLGFLTTHSLTLKRQNELFMLSKVFPNESQKVLIRDCNKNYGLSSSFRHVYNIPQKDLLDIEELFDIPSKENSDKLFYDVLKGTAGTTILTDYYLHQKKDDSIDVSISVKNIGHSTAGAKPMFQFECIIDNERVTIYIGETAPAVIYLYILLFAKAGKKIYRENLMQNCGIGKLPPYLECLRDAYNIFFDTNDDSMFRNWINKINKNNSRGLNQGKSNINRHLVEELKKEKKEKGLTDLIVKRFNPNYETAYGIELDSSKIFLPDELNSIVESIKNYDFDKKFGNNFK